MFEEYLSMSYEKQTFEDSLTDGELGILIDAMANAREFAKTNPSVLVYVAMLKAAKTEELIDRVLDQVNAKMDICGDDFGVSFDIIAQFGTETTYEISPSDDDEEDDDDFELYWN